MREIPFCKLETVGNDFVLLDQSEVPHGDWPELSRILCERRFSVGSDGLMVIWREGDEIHLRFFNPDGSEDFCGNGLRCAAWYSYRKGWTGLEFAIHQLGQVIHMKINPAGRVQALMPSADYSPGGVPFVGTDEFIDQSIHGVIGTALTTGSAHLIAFCDELPDDEEFFRLGPLIETDPIFPERISVMWTKKITDRHLYMRIWERGVGETLGCGTGATAAASAWCRKHNMTGRIEIESLGGVLSVDIERWDLPIFVECDPEELFFGRAVVPESAITAPISATQ